MAGTIVLPIGQIAISASFKCAHAQEPMIVTARRIGVIRCPRASHQPASRNKTMPTRSALSGRLEQLPPAWQRRLFDLHERAESLVAATRVKSRRPYNREYSSQPVCLTCGVCHAQSGVNIDQHPLPHPTCLDLFPGDPSGSYASNKSRFTKQNLQGINQLWRRRT